MTELLLPDGTSYKIAWDLNIVHRRQRYTGGLVAHLTWNRLTGDPALVLTPDIDRPGHERIIPCVVPMETAWVWHEQIGDVARAISTAEMFAHTLGLPYGRRSALMVATVIRSEMDELRKCPPMPADDREITAEMLVRNETTGREVTKEIRDHV